MKINQMINQNTQLTPCLGVFQVVHARFFRGALAIQKQNLMPETTALAKADLAERAETAPDGGLGEKIAKLIKIDQN